jgi:tetratricopeptide (TPR) repeat protein
MKSLRWLTIALLIGSWLCLVNGVIRAEEGILVVHIKDAQRHPVGGLLIGVEGDGGSAITSDDGKARIALAKQTKEKSWVSLQILKSPPGKDFVMVSPWDYRAPVPSFENESENFIEVVVVQRGDRAALESGSFVSALATKINSANAPKTTGDQAPQDPEANLNAVAKQYGLSPEDLDEAIRSWGARTTDLEEAGQAALYARNYPKASEAFAESLREREERLAADQKAVADSAYFLGESFYGQGKYRESASAYQRCLQLRPEDNVVLSQLALSLHQAGEYAAAEPLYRRALAIDESALGPNSPFVAANLNNLASLLQDEGNFKEAEPLFRRALMIDEKALPPSDPGVAMALNNLAELLHDRGLYQASEALLRQALTIDQNALGPDDPAVARDLDGLAETLRAQGRFQEAEPLFRSALAINQKALGRDHPSTANCLEGLALVLADRAEYQEAQSLLRQALAINEQALGENHPHVARTMGHLATTLRDSGNYEAAEPLFRNALRIVEHVFGPNHPQVADLLNGLGVLLMDQAEYREAEQLFRQALTINEKALGADHPFVAMNLNNLALLLQSQGDYQEAEPLYMRALAIDEKTPAPDRVLLATHLSNLGELLVDKGSYESGHLTNLAGLLDANADYQAAVVLFVRALAINEQVLGSNNPRTQRTRDDLELLAPYASSQKSEK